MMMISCFGIVAIMGSLYQKEYARFVLSSDKPQISITEMIYLKWEPLGPTEEQSKGYYS